MTVRDNILVFRPRHSESPDRAPRRAADTAVETRVQTVEPKRPRTLERSSVPKMDAFEQENPGRTERAHRTRRTKNRSERSDVRLRTEAQVTAEPEVNDAMDTGEKTRPEPTRNGRARGGVRLVRPMQAQGFGIEQPRATVSLRPAAAGAGAQMSASVALPMDTPWTFNPPAPDSNTRRRRPTARERDDGYTERKPFAPALPDLSGVRETIGALLERLSVAGNRLLIAMICVGVSTVFLYSPVRELYSARRNEQILSTRLEHLTSGNEKLQESVASLQTREGIEDEAHKRGYVNAGETLVEVEGLGEYEEARKQDISELTAEYEDTTEPPVYIKVLDFVFQFEPGE